jgi:hypothetical protein
MLITIPEILNKKKTNYRGMVLAGIKVQQILNDTQVTVLPGIEESTYQFKCGTEPLKPSRVLYFQLYRCEIWGVDKRIKVYRDGAWLDLTPSAQQRFAKMEGSSLQDLYAAYRRFQGMIICWSPKDADLWK